ncbi:ABC transporter substrate-binding protein [Chloroflexota bacterium]
MKKMGIFIVLSLLVSMLIGCQPRFQPGTYTDDMGREVRIDKVPQRIISLAPSHTEILFALGLSDRVIGVTSYCNYPEEAKGKEKIGGFATAEIEKIIALNPDLILAFGTLQKSLVTELEDRGQTVFHLYPHNVKDILESFERIGEITGTVSAAKKLRKGIEERIRVVQENIKDIPEREKVTVFRVMGLDPPATIGGDAFQTDVYRLAGGRNVFGNTKKDYFQFDLQTLVTLKPDIIVVGVGDEEEEEAKARVRSQEGWGNLDAVKSDRIVTISTDLICRPSPRIAETIELLAKKFYPERFN